MRLIICLAFMLTAGLTAYAQQAEKFARVRVDLRGKSIVDLGKIGIETDHGQYEPGRAFTTDLSESEIRLVQEAGFTTQIQIADVEKWYAGQMQSAEVQSRYGGCGGASVTELPVPVNYTAGTMGGYHKYEEMLAILENMRAQFPNLITVKAVVSDTIVTHNGNPVYWVRISDNADSDENESEVLYTALHHAREPNGLSQMLYYMWYLLENYETDAQVKYMVDNLEMYFVPCLNPDGYLFNQNNNPNGGGMWRKNRRNNNDGTYGVDLNRNYGYEWAHDDDGSSPNTNASTYRGPSAFSEPETRMMRDFCNDHNFLLALNYHTFGNLLIYPWGYNNLLADPAFSEIGQFIARENGFKVGSAIETVGYNVNGVSDDWMFGAADILSYTPEVGPGNWGFWPPSSAIVDLNKKCLIQNIRMALCALRFGEARDLSEASLASLSSVDIPVQVKRYGYESGQLTLDLSSTSNKVASIDGPFSFDLDQFESATANFHVVFNANAAPGDTVEFQLGLSNGLFTSTTTLKKVFNGVVKPLFAENANNLDEWVPFEGWGLTNESFVSAPTSITDSPYDLYPASSVSVLLQSGTIPIPADAVNPRLRFQARWQIENDWDYAQVRVAGSDGNFVPLCGRYTNPGVNAQPFDEPIFDGSSGWVEECMDLSDFAGQNIQLSFYLGSDEFQEFDGFYFDDLVVEYYNPQSLSAVYLPATDFRLLQNRPNPSVETTVVSWENPAQLKGEATLYVFDVRGVQKGAWNINLNSQSFQKIDTRQWAPGVYTYYLSTAAGQSEMMRMIIK